MLPSSDNSLLALLHLMLETPLSKFGIIIGTVTDPREGNPQPTLVLLPVRTDRLSTACYLVVPRTANLSKAPNPKY